MTSLSKAVNRKCIEKDLKNPALNGVWGFIDGSMHKSDKPQADAVQREYYNGYYGVCGYKALYLNTSDGCIAWARLSAGTEHDNSLYAELDLLLHQTMPFTSNLKILGDSAFVPSDHLLRPYDNTQKKGLLHMLDEVNDYNTQISKLRIAAEWGVQDVKKFSIFRTRFSVRYGIDQREAWEAGLRLHNFVTRVTRINQTLNVYGGSAIEIAD
eukprot:CAMPEP_0184488292 /NCGR_PEP_ID=MMETSP0113_2-20130426/11106_1 /TAXON_ID=91329 /ORGANISM="Norrisiella sphaerica, Strain BC52" /LENGTH=211 /DNA_ID=CAMNT_0026870883 /DNA_START=1002 /DNA_END=1637 /DNA_ORIENTATION=-